MNKSKLHNLEYAHYIKNYLNYNCEYIVTNTESYLSTCISPGFIREFSCSVVYGFLKSD